ncbi:MAG: ATP-grasp domain-containing protein [Desulfobacterales bacterium]|nr:MAG: ATP-grasp domain-containing protein [Desulfobacterales bacterium]
MQSSNTRVLVVGTTSDYIDWIRNSCPGRALFLTDPTVRRDAQEPRPSPTEEILCDLSDYDAARRALQQHLDSEGLQLDGVACYDCESMELAAVLAREWGLPYPSVEAVNNCRDKYLSKTIWQRHGLQTPRVKQVKSAAEAAHFSHELGGPCVLKPLSGSGSELIFRCNDAQACENRFIDIQNGLQRRRSNRLYKSFFSGDPVILAEALVDGDEYSCDFMIQDGRVEIIRLTRKIISSHGPFGTALGYLLPGVLPAAVDEDDLRQTLARSASALGLERALCMLDFIIHQDHIFLLELAPRPGGDCLPFLLRWCWNLDVLKLFLDFCQGRPLCLPEKSNLRPGIGLRLHARQSGTLKKIDAGRLQHDKRVAEIYLTRRAGHQIKMPPEDYDAWLLGHIIFEPHGNSDPETQCRELIEKLVVEVE